MIEQERRTYLLSRIKNNSVILENGCIEWTGTKTNKGYGLIHFARKMGEGWNSSIPASRAVYQAHHNVILERLQHVCHRCDNPSCVNIEHLFLGSPKDNAQDKLIKGRNAKKYKLHTRHRVHDDETIISIKQAVGLLKDVAHQFGVSESYVSRIRNGKAKTLL